jgi:uncharacterized repeat protein (TIGR01451 family)
MFALKSRTELMIRVLLTAAILFNALVPTTAFAQAAAESLSSEGIKRSAFKISASSRSSRTALQAATPTVSPTNIETPTPELSVTPTSETTPTATVIPSHTQAETLIATLEPSATPTLAVAQTATQTPTASQPPALSYTFSASPEQAAPGDEVIFTIEVANNGRTPMTGLLFSNFLPRNLAMNQARSGISILTHKRAFSPGAALRQV